MKRTAVLLYNQFCNFEISVALELLAMNGKPITVFATDRSPVKSEEGITAVPDQGIEELQIDEFDSLLLPGAMDIREAVEDPAILEFIKAFADRNLVIGAISIAPVLLLKAGALRGKHFMAGVNQRDLLEEGFAEEDLAHMTGWDDNRANPVECGYVIADNIITSVSCYFVKWALGFGRMIGIQMEPWIFGL